MTQMMQTGKIYRMRQAGHQTYAEGFFKDNRFYEGEAVHVGDVEADGTFIYRLTMPDGSPKYPNFVAGRLVGLMLTRTDGTIFELIEQ